MLSISPKPLRALVALAGGLAIALTATGPALAGSPPSLSWSPSTSTGSYAYTTIDAGTTSSQTFTLRNSGGSGTSALRVTLAGSTAFTITANQCSATSLGGAKTCTVTVQYAPTTAGQSDTATLTATSNKPTAGVTQTLTGSATVPVTPLSLCKQELAAAGLTEPSNANYILGTDGNDSFTLGGRTNDVVCGFAGDDSIPADGTPNQTLQAGDIFLGDAGNDTVAVIYGGTFIGGAGNDFGDQIYGGTFTGGEGNDSAIRVQSAIFNGGEGNDSVNEVAALGTFNGGPGNDSVGALQGDFMVNAQGTFYGGDGDDSVGTQSIGSTFYGENGCDSVTDPRGGTFNPGDQSTCL